MLSLTKELFAYFRIRRRWWLMPILLALLVIGGVLVLSHGSALAPFIYTVF